MSGVTNRAEAKAHEANDSEWVERAARAGLVAYGAVHLVIAWLAVQLALGDREESADSTGAVQQLSEQPFGQVLVWAVAVGMFLLVVWQALEAVVGHQDEEGTTRLRKRVTSAGKAVIYAVIGVSAIRAATGSSSSGSGGGSGGTDSMTATVMDWPGGQLLVGAVGLGILGAGGYLVHKAWTEKFREYINAGGTSGSAGRAYVAFGKAGYTAKGVSLGIVGALFLYAAVTHDPKKSGGLDQALHKVLQQPFGPYLLVLIALGIACYGLFSFARARHFDE